MTCRLALSFAALVLATPVAAQSGELRVGQTTLPLTEGAVVVACGDAEPLPDIGWTNVCIDTPYAKSDDIMNGYAGRLVRSGWTFAGGAGPQYWIERNPADGVCELIYLTAIGPYGLSEEEALTAKGRILFSHVASGPCMADGSRK